MTIAEELRGIADRIEADPSLWCQGAGRRGKARCAAEWMTRGEQPHSGLLVSTIPGAWPLFRRVIGRQSLGAIANWNDAPERTAADVVAAGPPSWRRRRGLEAKR